MMPQNAELIMYMQMQQYMQQQFSQSAVGGHGIVDGENFPMHHMQQPAHPQHHLNQQIPPPNTTQPPANNRPGTSDLSHMHPSVDSVINPNPKCRASTCTMVTVKIEGEQQRAQQLDDDMTASDTEADEGENMMKIDEEHGHLLLQHKLFLELQRNHEQKQKQQQEMKLLTQGIPSQGGDAPTVGTPQRQGHSFSVGRSSPMGGINPFGGAILTPIIPTPRRPTPGNPTGKKRKSYPENATAICCNVCKGPFEIEGPKIPCILPGCFHTFCRECIAKEQESNKEGSFKCPKCEKPCKTQAKDLRTDPVLMDEVEAFQMFTWKKVLMCQDCERPTAIVAYLCQHSDCGGLWLCDDCSNHHQRREKTKEHTLQTFEELWKSRAGLPRQPQTCEKHQGQELRLFCLTCGTLICQDCTIKDHNLKDHDYQLIQDVEKQCRDALLDEAHKTDEPIRIMRESIEKIKAEEDALPDAERKAEEYITKFMAKVRADMLEMVSQHMAKRQKRLAEQRRNVDNALARLESAREHAQRTSELGSSQLLQSSKSIKEGVRGLLDAKCELQPSATADLKFVIKGAQNLLVQLDDHEQVISTVELKFERPFEGGLLEYLATEGFTREWSNPDLQGIVEVSWSSVGSECSKESFVDGLNSDLRASHTSKSGPKGAWMAVDTRVLLAPTYYCLRSDISIKHKLRNWELQGWNGTNWVTLVNHEDDKGLAPKPCSVASWPIKGFETTFFRHFRIIIPRASRAQCRCQGIELWGHLGATDDMSTPGPPRIPAYVDVNLNDFDDDD